METTAQSATAAVAALLTEAIRQDSRGSLDRVMVALAELEGKTLTKRHKAQLEAAAGHPLFIGPQHGRYRIEAPRYGLPALPGEEPGWCISLNWSESCPVVDCDWIRSDNLAYFSAADTRNALRAELLADTAKLQRLGELIATINTASAELKALTAYPCPDQYRIQNLAGLG